jgi:hypothetical protein
MSIEEGIVVREKGTSSPLEQAGEDCIEITRRSPATRPVQALERAGCSLKGGRGASIAIKGGKKWIGRVDYLFHGKR